LAPLLPEPHYAGLRTIVIPGTHPDAPYALDALLDPQTSVRPREIMTDTAGYTDIMFALYRLLGYQYSPRLADAGAATLWRLNATDYGPLNQLARHQINTRLIREHYDDVLRIAGSLLQRHTTASQLVRALRSQTRHLATLARALQHIGRAPKTITSSTTPTTSTSAGASSSNSTAAKAATASPATSATAAAASSASPTAKAKKNSSARSA
jgi:TnpA family transposase